MILAVEPEHVAIHGKKSFAQQRQSALDPAAGVEELRFLRDLDAGGSAAAELGGDHSGLVVEVDDDTLDPDEHQPVDGVIEQRAAVYLNERFRKGFGHRA